MTANLVRSPFELFTNKDGKALNNAKVYIGQPGLNAEFNQVTVYWDKGLTIPAAQPIRTSGGYAVYEGSPSAFYVDGDYSIVIKDKNDELVFSSNFMSETQPVYYYDNVTDAKTDTSLLLGSRVETFGYTSIGDGGHAKYKVVAGATGTDDGGKYHDMSNGLQLELINSGAINVRKYGALGLTDDSARVHAALEAFKTAYIPTGYKILLESNLAIDEDDWTLYGDDFSSVIEFSGNNRRIHCVANRFTIKNLMIDGKKPSVGYETTNNTDYGVRIGEAVGGLLKGFKASGVKFKDIGMDGVLIDNISQVHIDEACVFQNCRRWGVAVIPSLFNIEDILIEGHYDCTNGTGPVGKEYPLGAVDIEQNDKSPSANYTIRDIRYGNIYANKGEISALDLPTSMTTPVISDCTVNDAFFRIYYNDASINNVTISGAEAYFRAGLSTTVPTYLRDISMRWVDSTRSPVVLTGGRGRANLFRADYADESVFGVSIGSSGSGSSTGRILTNVDGHDVYLRHMHIGAGVTGSYTLNQTVDATITAGDQLFLYVEVDRTDGSVGTDTAGFFDIKLDSGNLIDQELILKQGINRIVYAINAPANKVTPALSIGLSGTNSLDVDIVIRKCFLFCNPDFIDNSTLKIAPYAKSATYSANSTGFTVDPSGDVIYRRDGNLVTIHIESGIFTGTSDSTGFTITGMPVDIRPTKTQVCFGRGVDNSAGLTTPVGIEIGTNGTLTLSPTPGGGTWTASGTKALANTTFSYYID